MHGTHDRLTAREFVTPASTTPVARVRFVCRSSSGPPETDFRRLRSPSVDTGDAQQTPNEQLLFMEARLRIALTQLDQAEALRNAEARRCTALAAAAANPVDVETMRTAQMRVEIATVAASAAEGRVEALRLELQVLHKHD